MFHERAMHNMEHGAPSGSLNNPNLPAKELSKLTAFVTSRTRSQESAQSVGVAK